MSQAQGEAEQAAQIEAAREALIYPEPETSPPPQPEDQVHAPEPDGTPVGGTMNTEGETTNI